MRGEGMPQCMRRNAPFEGRPARGDGEPAAHVGGRHATAALREEHRGVRADAARLRRKPRPRSLEVALERAPGGLAGRKDADPPALSGYPKLLGIRVEIRD